MVMDLKRLFLLYMLSVPVSATMAGQCNQACPERRIISITAVGTATADADLAIVRVGYKLYGLDAKSAYALASETSNAVMQALTGSGIPKAAIESGSQVLQRTQQYELQQLAMGSEERVRRQFTVTQNWTVRVRPDLAGKTLDTAINAGANESGWIDWVVENPSALEAQASAKALANARVIAEQTVQKSDVHLGHLVSATQNQSSTTNRFNGAIAGMAGMGSPMGANQPLAINSRRVEYNVTLYAVFSIE